MWWNYGCWGFWWFVPLAWLLFIGFIVFIFWGRWRWWGRHGYRQKDESAEEILANRFARGEISEDEYKKRLQVLRGKG